MEVKSLEMMLSWIENKERKKCQHQNNLRIWVLELVFFHFVFLLYGVIEINRFLFDKPNKMHNETYDCEAFKICEQSYMIVVSTMNL